MAKRILESVQWASGNRGRVASISDFSPYVDGDAWELRKGEDFEVRAYSVQQAARKYAEANGYELDYKITAKDDNPPERIIVRFRKVPTAAS
jgi:hypothetical protein